MTLLQAIVLALLTALGACLPVSGAAHWKIAEKLMGMNAADPDLQFYKAMVYLGILLALLVFYRRQVLGLVREALVLTGLSRPYRRSRGVPPERRELIFFLFALVPLFFALIVRQTLFKLDQSDNALAVIAVLLALSGTVLFFADRGFRRTRDLSQMTLQDAVMLSVGQTFSVFPGLSRCGLTLSVGLMMGLDRSSALEFSGLLAIAAYLGAFVVQLLQAGSLGAHSVSAWVCVMGVALSCLASLGALRFLTAMARRHRLTVFSYWSWGAGIFALVLFLMSA